MKPEVWNVERFKDKGNLPDIVGTLENQAWFSQNNGIRVLDLCIKAPGQNWAIPTALAQFQEAVHRARFQELMISGKGIEYCYITVDQRPVKPGTSQRRDGWHSDAYIVDEQGRQLDVIPENAAYLPTGELIERTYVAYDALPTLFLDGPWDLPDPTDCDAVLKSFNDQAKEKMYEKHPIVFGPYTLLCLSPYCVHSVQKNETPDMVDRTFIKIQFSSKMYNREENTRNPNIDYTGWTWVPRDPAKREHRYVI